ncbi:hypothetical protein DAPPUDRAFT_120886 [Daphnia pulex]|uniref:Peptidase C1A papain C-terminal domain-containing protein n=1 Tax=Daphnia pulex TaxID=6669 RepID=E9I2E6_DAPPU|nr:hypothetical protein DAPPUDRAFT_120886 [Daphnia pulex]|eukprot:EFX61833.1 hypothetical protein DAPPUDRAFT_120886 [Daphnia pulex]
MIRFAIAFLMLCSVACGQIKLQPEYSVGQPIIVEVQYPDAPEGATPSDLEWFVGDAGFYPMSASSIAIWPKFETKSTRLVVRCSGPLVTADGKYVPKSNRSFESSAILLGVGGNPKPDPDIDPQPPVPVPDGEAPIKEPGFRVLITYESQLPIPQWLNDADFRAFLDKSCVAGKTGTKEWRITDKDSPAVVNADWLRRQAAGNKSRSDGPNQEIRGGQIMLRADDYVIDDANASNREGGGVRGLIPRNYSANPVGSYEGSVTFDKLNDELPLIPWEDMPDMIAEMVANKSLLSDIRNTAYGSPIPSLDQNGEGFCWFYSGTGGIMLLRAKANMPYVRLSAHAGACKIKNFRDQGGWGAQGLDFQRQYGVPSVEFWPEKSMDRRYDTQATWDNAALHKVSEGFIDLDAAQYDRKLSAQQVLTCLIRGIPVIADYNDWGHSVILMDPVDAFPNLSNRDMMRYGVRGWNSWTDGWGANDPNTTIEQNSTLPRPATAEDYETMHDYLQPKAVEQIVLPWSETGTSDFSFNGTTELIDHLRDHPMMGDELEKLHEWLHQRVEKLRPRNANGLAYSAILIEADDVQFAGWKDRQAIEAAGWKVVRLPARKSVRNVVAIGKTHFSHAGYLTIDALKRFVNQAENRKVKPIKNARAKWVSKITMYTRDKCRFCEQWMANDYGQAVSEGVAVELVTDLNGTVPRFDVCDGDGQVCRNYVGYKSYAAMKAEIQ